MDVLVVAKAPIPGTVKTRLCPPLTHGQAAALAERALADTLANAMASRADRVVLALDGEPGPWCPARVRVVPQATGSFDERLAVAWASMAGRTTLQIGMDTPHLGADRLDAALDTLADTDAVLGPAVDGGWWALGLRRPDPALLRGVPTSRPDTGARQRARLVSAGLRVGDLPLERDLDTWDDVVAVGYHTAVATP